MLRFLSALFSNPSDESGGLPDTLLEAAIERAVDGTDRRLRALGNYRKRLREPVACAVHHVLEQVGRLPAPAEISPCCYGHDPRLRAVFASPDHLRSVLGRFQTVKDYLREVSGPLPDDIFGLLSMSRRERSVLGMEVDGDALRRDVLQTAVSFSDHRFLAPTDSERLTRRELKLRAFDFLLECALERMVAQKNRRGELARERALLRRKLEALKSGQWGLGDLPCDDGEPLPDRHALEAEIESIDSELGRSGGMELALEDSLVHVVETLGRPAEWLALEPLTLNLDYRGVRTDADGGEDEDAIELSEASSPNGLRRVVLLARIPRCELPEPTDAIKLGQAYLG
jgi:hypothetical protein